MTSVAPRRRWRWIFTIPEPRVVRAFYAMIYAALLVAGVMVLVHPPMSIEGELGELITAVWGWFLVLGASAGFAAVLTPYWFVERVGIFLSVSGASVYAVVVLYLQFVQTGNRIVQLMFIIIAILTLTLRWVRIRGALIEPGR